MPRITFKLSTTKVGLICTIMIIFLLVFFYGPQKKISVLQQLELMYCDYQFKIRGIKNPGDNVVIIAIDDKSIKKIGRWPWDRKIIAKLVDILSKSGVRAIGLDIIFSEPQISSEKAVLSEVLKKIEEQKDGERLATLRDDIIASIKAFDSDQLLAESLKNAGNTIIAMSMSTQDSINKDSQSKPVGEDLENLKKYSYFFEADPFRFKKNLKPITAKQVLVPLRLFLDNTASTGNAAAGTPDIDGVIRKEWMTENYDDYYYPPFSFEVFREYLNVSIDRVKIIYGKGIQAGNVLIPTDERTRYLINYYGPQGIFTYYSFSDLLEGGIPLELLNGKVVLIGCAASGLGDQWMTPYGIMFGVEKQATLVQNFIDKRFIYSSKFVFIFDLFVVLLIGIFLSFVLSKTTPLKSMLLAVGVLITVLLTSIVLFNELSLQVNIVFPMLTVLFLYLSIITYRLHTGE